jgi:hypothetical protein
VGGRTKSGFGAKVARAFDGLRDELARDATFVDDYGNDLDRMRRLVTALHVARPLDLAAVFIGGSAGMVIPAEESRHLKEDTYMYAGLKLLREVAFDPKQGSRRTDALLMTEGQASVVFGDLTIDGSLRLEAQASLVVLGDLTIAGNLLADVWYSRVAVGGKLSFRNGATEGELIAGSAIHVGGTLYLHGNDVSCRAPRLEGNQVVVADKYNRFTTIEVASYVEVGVTPNALDLVRAMLGDSAVDADGLVHDAVMARIRAG